MDGAKVVNITGLSPPTRGNRPETIAARRRARSIPAHAGEPLASMVVVRME